MGCHTHAKGPTDASHAGIPDYRHESAACYGCHPKANVPAIDHTWFPIAAGTRHQGLACANCHPVPGDRKQLTCFGRCHAQAPTATAHSAVGGYAYQAPSCVRCHADAQVDRVTAHLPFLITSGTKHYRKSCLSCHPALRTDKAWGANFRKCEPSNANCQSTTMTCGPCHSQQEMDGKHQGRSGYSYNALSCIRSGCHPDGRK